MAIQVHPVTDNFDQLVGKGSGLFLTHIEPRFRNSGYAILNSLWGFLLVRN